MEDRFLGHFLGNFALLTNEKKLVSMIRTGMFQSESMDFSTVIENDGTGQQDCVICHCISGSISIRGLISRTSQCSHQRTPSPAVPGGEGSNTGGSAFPDGNGSPCSHRH